MLAANEPYPQGIPQNILITYDSLLLTVERKTLLPRVRHESRAQPGTFSRLCVLPLLFLVLNEDEEGQVYIPSDLCQLERGILQNRSITLSWDAP